MAGAAQGFGRLNSVRFTFTHPTTNLAIRSCGLPIRIGGLTLLSFAALIGLGLFVQPIHAQIADTSTTTPTAAASTPTMTINPPALPPTAIALFRDDFQTQADRWRTFDLPTKAAITYDVAGNALRLDALVPNYALWSQPDTTLAPDQFAIDAQIEWQAGSADSLFGLIMAFHSESDMLIAAVTQAGQVEIGRYYYGLWKDLTPPLPITLAAGPIMIHASIVALDPSRSDRQMVVSVDNQPVQTLALTAFQPGTVGVFARNGASGELTIALDSFVVSKLP